MQNTETRPGYCIEQRSFTLRIFRDFLFFYLFSSHQKLRHIYLIFCRYVMTSPLKNYLLKNIFTFLEKYYVKDSKNGNEKLVSSKGRRTAVLNLF